MLDDRTIETLKALGLTQLQAKLYFSLTKTGPTTIKSVATTADIARQDVYRIMDSLLKLGLAEKILQNPTMYKATPLKEGVNLLFENKKTEYMSLHKNTSEMVKRLSVTECYLSRQKEESFVISTSRKLVFKKFKELDSHTKESVNAVGDWKGFRKRLYDGFEDFCDLLKRGVRIRIITEKHQEDNAMAQKLNVLKDNPLFEIRYLPPPVPVIMAIFDEKAVQLCICPEIDDFQDLGSKNPQFMKITTTYFEVLWKKAEKTNFDTENGSSSFIDNYVMNKQS